MSWRSAFEYGIRGGVAAAAGAAEGQLAAMQATNEREHRDRMLQYQNKLADIEQFKAVQEAAFNREKLGEEGRRFDRADETERFKVVTNIDGEKEIWDIRGENAVKVANVNAASQERTAEIGAEADKAVAETGARATVDAATVKAEGDKAVAETVTQGKAAEGEADREMSYEIELLRAQTQNYSDDVKRDIAEKGYASNEAIAKWTLANEAYKAELDAQGDSGGARGTVQLGLNDDQIKRVDALAGDYRVEDDYKALQKLQREYYRAVNAYDRVKKEALDPANDERFNTGSADIALINIYQRFIDPGVSVREGDVELLQKGESIWNEIKVKYLNRAKEGYRLTPDAREEMFTLINDFYSTAMVELSQPLSERYQARIDLDGQLRDSGVKVSNLGTDFWEDYGQTVARQKGIIPAEPGDGDPDEPSIPPEETPTEPTPTEPADDDSRYGPPGSQRRTENVEKLAQHGIAQGWTEADVQAALTKQGADEDIIVRVLQRFRELQEAATPNTRSRQDFRNRGVKENDDADE